MSMQEIRVLEDSGVQRETRRLRVHHETRYLYTTAVTTSWHRAHLAPSESPCQRVLSRAKTINPQPVFEEEDTDTFGNRSWRFHQEQAHGELLVRTVSELETWCLPTDASIGALDWETMTAKLSYTRGSPVLPESLFAYPSPYVPRGAEFIDFSAAAFTAGRPLRDACADLSATIYRELQYNPQSTTIHTPAREALAQGSGVCQDFAHIMLACLRSRGLAARYVSGYLLTQPAEGQPALIGADASHAWVSVFMGEGHWIDFDPTNNRWGYESPGADYVRLAIGRDYGDVSPLRGVIHGGAHHRLEVGVTVTRLD